LGPVQRAILLLLADGTPRTVARVELDLMLDRGRAYGSLMALGNRGLAERGFSTGPLMEWRLSDNGQVVAEREHGLTEDADVPRCAHHIELGQPCQACRIGPWRCKSCGDVVRGGQRGPHRRDHVARGERKPRFTWNGDPQP